MSIRTKAFLYLPVKRRYNNRGKEGKVRLDIGKGMIPYKIKRAVAAGMILFLTGCAMEPEKSETQEEVNVITSMEEEPDLTYEVPVSLPNILINQLGYITDSTKTAIFCSEELPKEFHVIRADNGEIIYTGYLEDQKYYEEVGEYISYGDFSEVTAAGTYYIEAPMLGRSYSFEVGNALYAQVFREACLQYYYNRCGMTLTTEYAGERAHNACHTGKAVLRENVSISLDVSGGWHQDEMGSKDVVMAAKNIGVMLLAYELYEEAFGDDMGIPESGNGIPDILDEIKYEIEWLLKMQDQATGAVYAGVTVYGQDGGKSALSYVEPVKMESAKAFAMVLAKFSYLYQGYDTEYATNCLKAADRAWKYMELNGGEQTDPWKFAAAAELYRASGQRSCHRLIIEYLSQTDGNKELDEVTFLGYVTYISTKQQVRLELCENITKELTQKAEEISEKARTSVYLVEQGEGQEHNLMLLQNMMYLSTVDYMISNHEYETIIENHLHYFMGRNRQAISYVDNVEDNSYRQIDENLGIMKNFDADSKLILMLSEIVGNHRK